MGVFFCGFDMSTFFFKDFGKSAGDLLSKDFPTNEQLKVNSSCKDVKLAFTGKTKGKVAEGIFEPTWKVPGNYGLELKGSIKTGGEVSATASVTEKLAEGLKFYGTYEKAKDQKFETGVEYKYQDKAAITTKVSFPSTSDAVSADLSGVVFRNNWAFGVALATQFNEKLSAAPDKLSGGVQYKSNDYVASGVLSRTTKEVTGKFTYYRACGKNLVGAQVDTNHNTGAATAALALATKCDSGAVTKVTFGTSGTVSLSYKKKIDSNTNVTLGCVANTATKEYNAGLNIEIDM